MYRNKRGVPYRYNNPDGSNTVHVDVEDMSEMLRGQIIALKEVLEIPEVVIHIADKERQAKVEQMKKENEENAL